MIYEKVEHIDLFYFNNFIHWFMIILIVLHFRKELKDKEVNFQVDFLSVNYEKLITYFYYIEE